MDRRFEFLKHGMAEKFSRIKSCVEALLVQFADAKIDGICATAAYLADACKEYTALLPPKFRPEWLKALTQAAEQCTRDKPTEIRQHLVRTVLDQYHKIEAVPFVDVIDGPSFDQIYAQMAEQGRLRELFDKMIDSIENMLAAGAIRSEQCLEALHKILSLLRANRKGSIFSMRQTILSARFLWNFVKEALDDVPGIGHFKRAAEKTQEEMESELEEAWSQHEVNSRRAILAEDVELKLISFKENYRPRIGFENPSNSPEETSAQTNGAEDQSCDDNGSSK